MITVAALTLLSFIVTTFVLLYRATSREEDSEDFADESMNMHESDKVLIE
jgi:hypothetical protein